MTARLCDWCRENGPPLPPDARPYQRYHSQRCRQAAFRLRQLVSSEAAAGRPMRFAYADPPYPGRARKYYGNEPTYAGEVDHAELIASLESGGYDGWALSTSEDALQALLPLCPPMRPPDQQTRVCPWVKPIGAAPATRGPHNTWEPLIVVRGRKLRPGFRDWLLAQPARGGGSLPGRKPIKFCAFLFQQLGMLPGDELVDLYPGTGVVSRAWAELSRRGAALGDVAEDLRDASARAPGNASLYPGGDVASPAPGGDVASARAPGDASSAPGFDWAYPDASARYPDDAYAPADGPGDGMPRPAKRAGSPVVEVVNPGLGWLTVVWPACGEEETRG
jgi:hypothetical protein